MRLARASRRSNPRAPSTTFAPRSVSKSAVASPIPLLAPVITITLPSIPDITFLLGDQRVPQDDRRFAPEGRDVYSPAFLSLLRSSVGAQSPLPATAKVLPLGFAPNG